MNVNEPQIVGAVHEPPENIPVNVHYICVLNTSKQRLVGDDARIVPKNRLKINVLSCTSNLIAPQLVGYGILDVPLLYINEDVRFYLHNKHKWT